jgi:hypothetical protein
MNSKHNKIICKIKKRQHQNPLFDHIGNEISKNREKMYIRVQLAMKLSLGRNLVLNWVCLVFFFLNTFNLSLLMLCVQ